MSHLQGAVPQGQGRQQGPPRGGGGEAGGPGAQGLSRPHAGHAHPQPHHQAAPVPHHPPRVHATSCHITTQQPCVQQESPYGRGGRLGSSGSVLQAVGSQLEVGEQGESDEGDIERQAVVGGVPLVLCLKRRVPEPTYAVAAPTHI